MNNEFFLVSFPRSGNTWLRFLLGNIFNTLECKFSEVDFFNIHEIIPEYGTEEEPVFTNFPKVFKTHNKFTPRFKHSILLLRNPFDALLSYWDYIKNNQGITISLNDMILHEDYGVKAIVDHTNSYSEHCQDLLIITYEDMKTQTKTELKKICVFLGLDVNDDVLEKAVQQSSLSSMREIESRKGRKFGNRNYKFVRDGAVGNGINTFKKNSELREYILQELTLSPVLDQLYVKHERI